MGKWIEDMFASSSDTAAPMRVHFASAKEIADELQTPLGAIATWSSSLKNAFAILSNSCCPMFLVWGGDPIPNNSDERILFYNSAYLSLLKEIQHPIPFDESVESSWTEAWSNIQAEVEQVLATGQALRREKIPFPRAGNGDRNAPLYTLSYSAIWDETNQIKGVFATGHRVTAEEILATATVEEASQTGQELQPSHTKSPTHSITSSLQQAEAALQESEARFQAFMSNSPTSAWIADREGRILYLSPTYSHMFRFPQQDAVGKQIHEIYTEEFAQQFLENNRRVFQTGQVIETIETAPRSDGSIGRFLVYKFPIAQASGEMLLGGVAVDITEHKRTEETLRQREEALRLITNALPALIAYVDKDHCYRFNNQTYETWFGQPAASFMGQPMRTVLGDVAYNAVRPYVEQALSGQRVSFESQIAFPENGIRYIKADYVPHINSQGEVEGFFSLASDISDRKRIEVEREQAQVERERLLQDLTAERARFEAVLRQMPEGVLIADAASEKLILANERAMQILQHSFELNLELEDYDQRVPFQARHPNGQIYALDEYPLGRSLRTGEVVTHEEMEICHADGSRILINASSSPIFDSQGEIASAVVMLQDITERKQAEISLRQSEERARLAIRVGRLGTWRCNLGTSLVELDERMREIWGEPDGSGTIPLPKIIERIHPDDRERVESTIANALSPESLRTYEIDYRIVWDDGTERWVSANGRVRFDGEGKSQQPIDFFGTALDITDRKQTEAALRQSEEQFRRLANAMPQIVWTTNVNGEIDYVSQQWLDYAGLTLEQTQDPVQYIQVIHPDDVSQLYERWAESIESSSPFQTETRIKRASDGTYRWFLTRAVPVETAQGQIIAWYGTSTDIDDRKQAEAALRQSEERLRLAQLSAGAGLWNWDMAAHQIEWSEEYYRLYGLDATVTPSYENWLASILEIDRDRVDSAVREALKHQIDINVEFRILHPTQGERWLTAIGKTFYDENRQPKRMTGIALDITERKQAEKALERYQLLSEHSRDIVLYFHSNGQILEANQAAVQTYGYDRAELLTLKITDLRAPNTLSALPEQFEQASQRGILFETVHRRKDGSFFPVEVSVQSAVINDETMILSVIRDITERRQAEAEREQLLVREQAAREAAEAAERRAEFLAEASKTLTSSLDYESTLKSVAQAVVPTLADWCAVDILKDDGTLERLATAHIDPAKVQWGIELHRRYPPDLNAPKGIAQAMRTGQSEYYPTVSDAQIVAAARDDEHLRILREIGFSSVMLVPLKARDRTLGTISFVAAESGRSYSLEDLSLAEELARRAAIALDNARLYQEAQQARQTAELAADRTARLQAVTAALSESLTPEQVVEVVVEQSIATLEATAALVVLVSNDRRELEIVKSVGYEADLVESWRRFSIDLDVPLAKAIRSREPVWVETVLERIERYPHLAEVYSRYSFKSWIAIPLVVEGRSVGGMLLSFNEFKHLNQDDREFILALSRQCAQAIVRAQLYTAEQQARAEAEQANRTKDEFLAVLSHELRTPLNPILGWAKLLQTRQFDASGTKRALETIERNAKLQTQLIDDLLDVSRILRGKMMLNVCDIQLGAVIDAAIETVRLSAEAKSITIHKVVVGDVALISGDSGRLQQVMWNLLSNAIKFTPPGGHIDIGLEQVGTQAQIQVRDTGKGITPEFLPHVFEHFRQEDGTTTRKFGGLGLGLAIVRYLTELHGGTVQAESLGEELGATFTVLLPLSKTGGRETFDEIEASSAKADSSPLANVRILVVDDEADMRELTFTVLNQSGAEIKVAASAAEALEEFEAFQPDILISDIGMPEMDGYALLRQVRTLPPARGGDIPAIALTAYAGELDQQQALAAGFQQHLAKPIEPEALIKAIAALVKS